ncbi:hypothetical protein Tco_0319006 [Tanacetum coccineum]
MTGASASVIEDSSDNEDAETGHWKSKNKYRDDEDEDMSRPWRRQKVDAFTRRISDFSEDKKRPPCCLTLKLYDGQEIPNRMTNLKFFVSAGHIENWPQPVGRSVPRTLSSLPGVCETCRPRRVHKRLVERFKVSPTTATAGQRVLGAGNDRVTPLSNDPKGQILATEGATFPRPPPMRTPEEHISVGNGYCEYHRQKGHTTNECVQLRQLIDKLVKEGRLDHLVKNIKEGKDKQRNAGLMAGEQEKTTRDKAEHIFMNTIAYNGIIGRPRDLGDTRVPQVPSGPRGCLKFPVGRRNCNHFYNTATPPKRINTVTCEVCRRLRDSNDNQSDKLEGRDSSRLPGARSIMREVYYHDWLSNPVMVKKSDGSWRMCVDFTDLNKACPQDCYPLPEIDWRRVVVPYAGYPMCPEKTKAFCHPNFLHAHDVKRSPESLNGNVSRFEQGSYTSLQTSHSPFQNTQEVSKKETSLDTEAEMLSHDSKQHISSTSHTVASPRPMGRRLVSSKPDAFAGGDWRYCISGGDASEADTSL